LKVKRNPSEFFEVSPTLQPPLLDILDLRPGVGVKQEGGTREGPAMEEVLGNLSRRGFLARAEGDDATAATSPAIRGLTLDVDISAGGSGDNAGKKTLLNARVSAQSPATMPIG
ncbi:unnamed protein product, partial [Discosporangium mesarthrocarpum]